MSKFINPVAEIITDLPDGNEVLKHIEKVARTCYQSESNDLSAGRMVRNLISRQHEAMLEHFSLSVRFTTDRGVSHEQVRHRIASFAQESTRYCNYAKDKFGSEITFISPLVAMSYYEGKTYTIMENDIPCEHFITKETIAKWIELWVEAMNNAEKSYMKLIGVGCPTEFARGVLPNSVKTSIVVTMNLREWRHYFKLRVLGTTGKPHPQMYEVSRPLLDEMNRRIPVVFEDLVNCLASSAPYADNPAEKGGLANAT